MCSTRESGAFTDWPDSGLTRTRTITGLRSGRTYQVQVQAKNPEGKGPWSDRANGTTLTAPTVSSVAFTSSPASGQNGAYKRDDVMDVTATFNDTVAVIGMPQIDLTVGSTVRQADYQSGSTTPQLLFQYTVQATDEDKDGATINANGLKLNGGRIRKNNTAINADLAHAARTNRSGHRVDGIAPALTEAEVKSDELALSYGEVLDGDPRPATGDFAVAVDDTAHSVTAVTMYTSEVSLTLASAVTPGQTVRLAYTPGTNPIRDRARNPAIALTNLIVANRTQDPALNVCSRTTQVRDAIVAASPVSTCGAVTADHLSAITRLPLIFKNISTLKADDFSGLTNLETLHLNDNSLSSLPDGIFSGLTALKTLKLEGNTVDPLPITVSLELVASGQLKAKVHTGAPFEMALPLNVVNGTIDGGTGSIEISQGSQESNVLTVSRTTGTAAAVTVDIGTFPDLPGTDSGYALVKSADLPLEVIAGLPEVKIYPTALSVAVSDSNTYTMALNSRPTMDVTVKVNVPTGSDVSVNPMERMFAAETYDMSQTVTVIADSDAVANDMVMLSHMVSGGDYQDVLADTVSVTIIGATSTNQSPTFTSASTFDVKENETEVGTVVATDVDARDYITGYEITGGAHQAQFSITSGGILTFVTAPDYEHPVASNNVYGVQVTASSGTGTRERTATQTITVVIDDVDEPPGQPPAPIISISSTRSSLLVSSGRTPLTNTGPDITAYEIQYRVKDTGDFKSTSLTLVPDRDWPVLIEELNRNQTYEVQVRAKNDEGESEWSPSAEATIPNASPIASSIDDVTLPAGGVVERVNVDDVFDDPDDSRLRYTALSSNSAAATVQTIDGVVLITPVATGTATITVMATDPWSATTSTTFDAIIQSPTLQTPTLSISGNLFTFGFTDNFAANETRAYQIRIRQKTPIGQWATGCFTATNDDNSPITLEDLISDFFEPGTTYEADYGYLGTDCGDSVIGVRSATAEATTDGTPSFDIDLVFVGSISSKYRTACETAARRWEQIITHDIPKHSLSSRWRNLLDTLYPGTTAPEVVDDLVIYVEIEEIDGEGGTLGQAGPDVWRVPSSLPIAAGLELDEDDLGTMSNQRLAAVILHEIGHTLGYGLGQWDDHNLLKNPSLDVYNNRIVPAPDTHFSGANAIAAFNDAGGSSYSGAKVPVENTRGGSEDSHWRESVLDNELMTPSLASTGPYPLSAITIQSLADIGYRVDVTQADAYTLPSSSSSSTRTARASGKDGGDLILLNCIVTHPEAGPDEPEPIILNLRSTPEGE